jgi:signal transduction histidine kinase/iron only hydrogenase large subunit-like protein
MQQAVTPLPTAIYVDRDKCVNCHACIAVCPVKTCNDGSGSYVNVHANSCIGCGRCLAACTHEARFFTDDFIFFTEAVAREEKLVAITAPSVASNFPDCYLRLNGWLKSLGISAVFDVSFGAELCAKSYAAFIRRYSPQVVIAQPCPAIVTYIQVHHPELIRYLAPVDSPMLHTMKMLRRYFPQYADHKIVVISPCPAKKREQVETGYGDYNVTYQSIAEHLKSKGIDLVAFPEAAYETPTPDTAVLFPQPRGLVQTLERWLPGVAERTRTIEGQEAVYPYLAALPDTINTHPATVPLLIDCLSCRNGCNCGPAGLALPQELDAVEYRTERRHHDLRDEKSKQIGRRDLTVERLLFDYWSEDLYTRQYADLAANSCLRYPSPGQRMAILASMHKYSPQDQYNCCSCGYGKCLDMTVAIYNGLNRPENCHHYLAKERDVAQHELTEYRDHLEKLVATRTLDLQVANTKLAEAKSMAESADHAKSEFLANISHELRTPLHGILSYARFGLDETIAAEQDELHEFFGNVDRCARTLLNLVNDLLDLAKLESGRMRFDCRSVDLGSLIEAVIDEFRSFSAEQGIAISYQRPPRTVHATIDPDRIQQVLRNLLSNAVKFSPPSATIDVQLQEEYDRALLSVRDEGPGIAADELEAVFDKFYQSAKAKSEKGGTGLGLAICREIVGGHQGRIWAENNAGAGCVFFVELPLPSLCPPTDNTPLGSNCAIETRCCQ